MKKRNFTLLVMSILGILAMARSQGPGESDLVTNLPGLKDPIRFRHYSGYLNGGSGKNLHYWFVESEKNPEKDPLLLWLNGGPGCSSMEGMLAELGPFQVTNDGKSINLNPYSWNKIANVIFLESPVGVGFSYSDDGNVVTDDDKVSLQNFLALQDFFHKFPQFKKNDFYVTGESYAGIYVPTLSERIISSNTSSNFKGFAIGNGLLSYASNSESLIFFAYYHGLIGDGVWDALQTHCCQGVPTKESCNFTVGDNVCQKAVETVNHIIGDIGLNIYNLYSDCSDSSRQGSALKYGIDLTNLLLPFLKLVGKEKTDSLLMAGKYHQHASPPCISDDALLKYLNGKDVRAALHISPKVKKWDICSQDILLSYGRVYETMEPQFHRLLKHYRGLVYNGDIDMACNFLGDEWFVNSLNLQVTNPRKPWYFNNQVAGFVKRFHNLDLLTIKGAGHMVPEDKPGQAFKMIASFLYGKNY
ncbi:unnamed protein product [Darwinula stevensoni]|uniref:Carboxypeptidase n=1 Tax=Darwinula stevensoni TaxID=69355 RepID=A0A7R8X778_9CRUS|nr:unnamed protein product [Darwinula stevensoni]CAG0880220.1 unnamed protein product [Darwinula stevensoni]